MRGIIILIALLGAGYYFYSRLPQSADYLHGTWEVVQDPGNPGSTERFKFTADGAFLPENGPRCSYKHVVNDVVVSITCPLKNGKTKEMAFSLSDDKAVLTRSSGVTYKRIAN
ncbi:MAG: hypothetical protein MI754_16960 [Chromatiales bacterium]|nr:hypothetical protein [Chromatiales bacterium]